MRTMTLENAVEVNRQGRLPQPEGPEQRYTVYAELAEQDVLEEIDVNAVSRAEARAMAEAILEADYMPGMRVIEVDVRFGLYF